jgi:hypothetical protein
MTQLRYWETMQEVPEPENIGAIDRVITKTPQNRLNKYCVD